jgi:hypothetical protein
MSDELYRLEKRYITHEMATDAGEPEREGEDWDLYPVEDPQATKNARLGASRQGWR